MKSVREAAHWLGVSLAMIYSLCNARKLKHYRFGLKRGKIMIDEKDLESFKERQSVDTFDAPARKIRKRLVLKHLTLS